MGLFNKLFARLQDNWCKECKCEMEKVHERLFALPDLSVSHYVEHKDADYYKRSLRMVNRKEDIPPGMYACGAAQYRCQSCGKRVTVMDPFLPVRSEEKHEGTIVFEHGELDEFLWR